MTANGGRLLADPAAVGPGGAAGAFTICADREGAGFRLWRAGARRDSQLVNAPSAWNFSHLRTHDLDDARAFYEAVFGWEYSEMPGDTRMWRVRGYGDHLAATSAPDIYVRQAGAPEGFADVVGTRDTMWTREADLQDPQGAALTISQFAPPAR